MKKKNALFLGTILATVAPIAAVVSCGDDSTDNKTKTTIKPTQGTNTTGVQHTSGASGTQHTTGTTQVHNTNPPATNTQTQHTTGGEQVTHVDSIVNTQTQQTTGGTQVTHVDQPVVNTQTQQVVGGSQTGNTQTHPAQPPASTVQTPVETHEIQPPVVQPPSGAVAVRHGAIVIKDEAKIDEINIGESIDYYAVDIVEGANVTNDMIISCFNHVGDVEIKAIGAALDTSTPGIYKMQIIDKGIDGKDASNNAIKATSSYTELWIRVCAYGEAQNGLLSWASKTFHGQTVLRQEGTNTYTVDVPFGTIITKKEIASLFSSVGYMTVMSMENYHPNIASASPALIKVRDNGIMGFTKGQKPNPGVYNSASIYIKVLPKMANIAKYVVTPPSAPGANDAKITVDSIHNTDGSSLWYSTDGWIHYQEMAKNANPLEAGPFSAGQDVQFAWVKPDSSFWDNGSWLLIDQMLKIPTS